MTELATQSGVGGLIPAGTWSVDGSHSTIEFGIRHLLITTVKGTFGNFEGTIEVAPDGAAKATGVIASESIDTNEPQRDEHLRSADFFDTATFPEIRFESIAIGGVEGTAFTVAGELTIRGITRPIELEAFFEGAARDPWGNDRIGLTVRGHLDPNDYGVDWNQELEAGGNLLGDRVDFTASISAVKAA
ncbi:MAG TPA: YceI family protein [Gaiellaceae bacterium]|nr:YceI family protein [Gaiellaceae bacterium]